MRSALLSLPTPTPSPSPQPGTPAAQGHRWLRDNFPGPGRRQLEFVFLFAFPNCACGFPGAAAAFGFHGRFCADPKNRRRHKRGHNRPVTQPHQRRPAGWDRGTGDGDTAACPTDTGGDMGAPEKRQGLGGSRHTCDTSGFAGHCRSSGGDTNTAQLWC